MCKWKIRKWFLNSVPGYFAGYRLSQEDNIGRFLYSFLCVIVLIFLGVVTQNENVIAI